MFNKRIQIIAIDFGSNNIRVLIGEQTKDGNISIIGHGTAPSSGAISRGLIQEMDSARHALHEALSMAQQKTYSISPKLIAIGINTPRAETYTKEGTLDLKNEEISFEHLQKVFTIAQQQVPKSDKDLLNSLYSFEWYIDNFLVKYPLGMKAEQLKIRVHFTIIPKVIIENLKSCADSELHPSYSVMEYFVYNPIATAIGSLTPEEMELGTLLIDIGKTTTNLTLFSGHKLIYASTFDFGTIFISRDVSSVFKIDFEEAHKLICDYGISEELINKYIKSNLPIGNIPLSPSLISNELRGKPISLQTVLDGFNKNVSKIELEGVIFARVQEMITTLKKEIEKKDLTQSLLRGIVLAGGGANLQNMNILIEKIFNTPVRIAKPQYAIPNIPQSINNPEFATVVGILRDGFSYYHANKKRQVFQNKKIISQLWITLISPFKKQKGAKTTSTKSN
ncbi:MAG: cell division protein FtsA [Candidatus Hydrogenedens sp.]